MKARKGFTPVASNKKLGVDKVSFWLDRHIHFSYIQPIRKEVLIVHPASSTVLQAEGGGEERTTRSRRAQAVAEGSITHEDSVIREVVHRGTILKETE